MRRFLGILFIFSFFFQCEESTEGIAESEPGPIIEASATIFSIGELEDLIDDNIDEDLYEVYDEVIGTATFSYQDGVVTLEISLSNMTPNSMKAVHIHNGSIHDPGRHWNRGSAFAACNLRSLGEVWAKPFVGDVGNVEVDESGNGYFNIQTDLWSVNSGDETDLLDLTIIVHDNPEDFLLECDPSHIDHVHSNLKIGGGSIELVTDVPQQARVAITEFPDFTICN